MTPTTFLFDLDGTLVDSVADLATGVNLLRAELDLPPLDLPTVRLFVGDGATALVTRSLPEGWFTPLRLQRFLDSTENTSSTAPRSTPASGISSTCTGTPPWGSSPTSPSA